MVQQWDQHYEDPKDDDYYPKHDSLELLALRRNLTEWPFHAAFRQATNSVLVAAMRCAFNSR